MGHSRQARDREMSFRAEEETTKMALFPVSWSGGERALSATFVNFYPMRFRNISGALKFGFLRSEKKKGYKSSLGDEVKLQGKG